MKRIMLVSAILCIMPWCAPAGASNPGKILEPVTFMRGTGSPVTEVIPFSAAGDRATLKLSNNKVSSATVAINGGVVFGPSDFNQNAANLERKIQLAQGQNTLEVILQSQPGSWITVEIVQAPVSPPPEDMLARTAAALRAGDMNLASQGFLQNEKTRRILPTLDAAKRHQLAYEIENAVIVLETERSRYYRYNWIDASGSNFIEFAIAIDGEGKWVITSW